jgi:hypothetical protein
MADKFCRRLEEVEAVQAKANNLEELRKFAGAVQRVEGRTKQAPGYYTVPGLNTVLWDGSWLVKHPNGRLEIKSSQLFHREYEPK